MVGFLRRASLALGATALRLRSRSVRASSQPLIALIARRLSGTTGGELAPVEAEVDDKQGSEREGDDADGGEGVAKMAPVAGPEIEHAAGDEGKRDCIGANHPLAMLGDLAVTRGDEGGGGADDPGGGLHGGSWHAGAAGGEGDPGQGTDKDGDDVDAAEDAMEFQVTLAKARRELQGPARRAMTPQSVWGMRRWRSAMTCRR